MSDALEELGVHIETRKPDCVVGWSVSQGELTVEISASSIPTFTEFLKTDQTCKFPR